MRLINAREHEGKGPDELDRLVQSAAHPKQQDVEGQEQDRMSRKNRVRLRQAEDVQLEGSPNSGIMVGVGSLFALLVLAVVIFIVYEEFFV